MPWPDGCEALEQAVAAEVVQAAFDVAIAVTRDGARAVAREYKCLDERARSQERRMREARSAAARDQAQASMDLWRFLAIRSRRQRDAARSANKQDRAWQNRRYGISPRHTHSTLPYYAQKLSRPILSSQQLSWLQVGADPHPPQSYLIHSPMSQ